MRPTPLTLALTTALAALSILTPTATADVIVRLRPLSHSIPFVDFTHRNADGTAVRQTASAPDAAGFFNIIVPSDPPTPGTMCYFDEDGILVCLIIGALAPNQAGTLPMMPVFIDFNGVDGAVPNMDDLPPFQLGQPMTIFQGASPALGPLTARAYTVPPSAMTPEQLLSPDALPLYTGTATVSGLIELRIEDTCIADWNDDGRINSTDISAYLTAWLAAVQTNAPGADINADGQVNSSDVSAYLTAWLDAIRNGC